MANPRRRAQAIADGGQSIAVRADVTRPNDVHRIIGQTLQAFGKPNILFNIAGVNQENRRPLTHIPDEEFDRTIELNLKGPFLMMKHVAPHMMESGGGSIINTASISAFTVVSTAGYSASKAGLVAMTRVAAAELGRYNIRVNALCPGATMTPLAESQRPSMQARGLARAEELMQRVSVFKRMAEITDGAYYGPSRGHLFPRWARRIGRPRAYGYGASMGAWVTGYLSGWAGEHGRWSCTAPPTAEEGASLK